MSEYNPITNQTTGYCVKCKTKKEIKNPKEVIFKGKGGTDRKMLKGECPVCGTTVCRMLPSKKTTGLRSSASAQVSQSTKIESPKDQGQKTNTEKEVDEWDNIT